MLDDYLWKIRRTLGSVLPAEIPADAGFQQGSGDNDGCKGHPSTHVFPVCLSVFDGVQDRPFDLGEKSLLGDLVTGPVAHVERFFFIRATGTEIYAPALHVDHRSPR